jgi:hypothetical protein
MSEYVPIYLPGDAIPVTLSATASGGQLLAVSGNGTVAPSSAASGKAVGVAAFDGVSGDKVTMFGRGPVHRLTASGTVTAGDLVEPAASGAVATHAAGTNDAYVFGVALTTATTGNPVEIMEV